MEFLGKSTVERPTKRTRAFLKYFSQSKLTNPPSLSNRCSANARKSKFAHRQIPALRCQRRHTELDLNNEARPAKKPHSQLLPGWPLFLVRAKHLIVTYNRRGLVSTEQQSHAVGTTNKKQRLQWVSNNSVGLDKTKRTKHSEENNVDFNK